MKQLLQLQILCTVFITSGLLAQPANDECAQAIELTDLTNWCSNEGEFSNTGATGSPEERPRCFTDAEADVWFSFQAISTSLNIRILGDIVDIYGITEFRKGTITQPRLALYSGSCDDLALVACDQDDGDQIAELFHDEIVPNSTYFLRVSSTVAEQGTFQLCISSHNVVPDPISDCPTGVVLCDKNSFFVPLIEGAGEIADEVNSSVCTQMQEDNSAWYKWVAGSSGSLGFTITPNNPGDDIDFVVYELPNGLNDCSDKIEIRCMASGANGVNLFPPFVPAPFDQWDECTGPTGLSTNETDFFETAGCQTGIDNNFAAAFDMEEGKTYALVVLNFSATGHGFSLEFNGTGEFLGPTADFVTDDLDGTLCFDQAVTYFDQSSFGDLSLVQWQWNFGEAAVPQTVSGPGPHQVSYTSPGVKSIALTVESETGCLVTEIGSVIVEDPIEVLADIVHQSCPEVQDGRIAIDINSSSNVTSVLWDNGGTGRVIENLEPGDYQVTITNFNGCDTVTQFTVEAPVPVQIDQIITRPSCGGGSDGSIALNVSGQAPPFQFDFGSGFGPSNTANNLTAAIYPIQIQDANGCITDLDVALGEIEIVIDPNFDPIQPPSCFGFNDGRVEIKIVGGQEPFQYDWRINGSYAPENSLDGVGAGVLSVAIRDDLGCLGFAQFDVPQPDPLSVVLDTQDISCFGAEDGVLIPLVFGGTRDYEFSWDHGIQDSLAKNLSRGEYILTITDANGCQVEAAGAVAEPPELSVLVDSTLDVVCFGDASGSIFFTGFGGSPPFTYSLDGQTFSEEPSFNGLIAGNYALVIQDGRGCTNTVEVDILQPDPLMVDAGRDTSIDLGFSARLFATHVPIGKPVDYRWSPAGDCDDCPFPVVRPLMTTSYQVTIIDDDGCTAHDSVEVFVVANRPIYIPNAFTPNDDGFNDRVTVYGGLAAQRVKRIQIFDRWGETVFEGSNFDLGDVNVGWDGTHRGQPMNPGVFVYLVEVEFIDGSILAFDGDITLIR